MKNTHKYIRPKKEASTVIKKYRHYFFYSISAILHINYDIYYKIRHYNTRLIVEEIVSYLQQNETLIVRGHLNLMIEEFIYLTKEDPVFTQRYDFFAKNLVYEISKAREVEYSYPKLLKSFLILKNEFDLTYSKTLQGLLGTFLLDDFFDKKNDDYEKKLINFERLIYNLIAELKKYYSREYLDYFREQEFENNYNFERAFNNFINLLFNHEDREYDAYLRIDLFQDFISEKQSEGFEVFKEYLIKSGLEIVTLAEVSLIYKNLNERFKDESFLKDSVPSFFIRIRSVKGISFFKVADESYGKIKKIIDPFLVGFNTYRVGVHKKVLLKSSHSKYFLVKKNEPEYMVHIGTSSLIEKMRYFFENNNEDVLTQNRLSKSLEYYRLFSEEDNHNQKLLFLWIALENLFSDASGSLQNYELMKSILPKIKAIYLLRDLCDEMQLFLNEKITFAKKMSNFIEEQKYKNIISKIEAFNLIDGKHGKFNNVSIYKALKRQDSQNLISLLDNSFYEHKYSKLAKIILLDDKGCHSELANFFTREETKARWNIARIYRTRNHIVHGGYYDPAHVNDHLCILENYYFLLVKDVIDKLTSDKYKTHDLGEYYDRLKRSYDFYKDLCKNKLQERDDKLIVLPYFIM